MFEHEMDNICNSLAARTSDRSPLARAEKIKRRGRKRGRCLPSHPRDCTLDEPRSLVSFPPNDGSASVPFLGLPRFPLAGVELRGNGWNSRDHHRRAGFSLCRGSGKRERHRGFAVETYAQCTRCFRSAFDRISRGLLSTLGEFG